MHLRVNRDDIQMNRNPKHLRVSKSKAQFAQNHYLIPNIAAL